MKALGQKMLTSLHTAAILSLRRIGSWLFWNGKPRTEFASAEACRAKTKPVIPLRLNMAAEW